MQPQGEIHEKRQTFRYTWHSGRNQYFHQGCLITKSELLLRGLKSEKVVTRTNHRGVRNLIYI